MINLSLFQDTFPMNIRKAALCSLALVSLGACDLATNTLKTDRAGGMEIQDYRDALAPRDPEINESSRAGDSIPAFQPYVSEEIGQAKPSPLVSLSVNQNVPLRDVLYELAEQADYDLELDPNIRGAIIFTARERPFDQVIERIADMAGLRYKFDDEVLRIEVDTPYNKTYKIDYLNYVRSNTGSVRNNIAVVSGDGADTGSTFEAATTSEADFWGELEANVGQILGNAANRSLRTTNDPRITSAQRNPEVVPVSSGQDGQVNVSPPDVELNVGSLPIDDGLSAGNGAGGAAAESEFSFAVNKQAGLLTVHANEKAHKELHEYLNDVRRSVTSQVLIEAKILEVGLDDQFSAGIDWNVIGALGGEGYLRFTGPINQGTGTLLNPQSIVSNRPNLDISTSSSATNSNFLAAILGNDIEAILQAIQGFGTVKALASPRLTVLNNQSAVMNVATNQVFFEIDIDRTQGINEQGDTIEIDSEIRNVPEGVLVNVIPSINLDEGTVSLALRPTITRIVNQEQDPAVSFISADIVSLIPELNVQEIDSVIKVNSGQAIVLGGLLQDRVQSTTESVPVVGELPVVGNLFKKRGDAIQKTELVILLKATIIEGGNNVHNSDKDLYRKFSGDRRPFEL
tara:strand:+ start:1148 stop:3034 length:1887 start_codon:yes stop_codon:yes gene_type:complete